MDFDLSDEQQMLKDSVERLIGDRYHFENRKKYLKEEPGYSRAMWAQYAEMGLLGLPFEERHGGSGGGAVETMIVMEAFGRGLILEPYLATVVLGGGLVQLAGNEAQRAAILPKVADGSLLLAFAHCRAAIALRPRRTSRAPHKRDARRLDTRRHQILRRARRPRRQADRFARASRATGASRDGIALFLVDANAPGVSRPRLSDAGRRCAPRRSGLRGVKVSSERRARRSGQGAGGDRARRRRRAGSDRSRSALARCRQRTRSRIDYLKTRKQFGVADRQLPGAAAPRRRSVRRSSSRRAAWRISPP